MDIYQMIADCYAQQSPEARAKHRARYEQAKQRQDRRDLQTIARKVLKSFDRVDRTQKGARNG